MVGPLEQPSIRGRGADHNPSNRFERIHLEDDPEFVEQCRAARADNSEGAVPSPPTLLFDDPSRAILSTNESPDVGFDVSLNPYRGCEHGCSYCYARPTHEYLGFSAGLDFETRIFAKRRAPQLLRAALSRPCWSPQVIAIGGVTDGYQPAERRLGLTRRCLEVLVEFRNPVAIVTKSALVTRDADLLGELAGLGAASVSLSITTLDRNLHRRMEPRAATPERRLAAVEELSRAGIPVNVMVAPVIPGLNDHEIPAILGAAARAGARSARYVMLRLPHGVEALFEAWLARHYPERQAKVLGQLRDVRGGSLNDSRFHSRMRGRGPRAEQVHALFNLSCRREGLSTKQMTLSHENFRRTRNEQMSFFASEEELR